MRFSWCLGVFSAACATVPPTSAPQASLTPSATPSGTERAADGRGSGTSEPQLPPAQATLTVAKPSEKAWERCGALECLQFVRSVDALSFVLNTTQPRILAIGESHAPKGSEGVPSTTAHVRDEWLPALRDRASDLVIELPMAPAGCEAVKRAVVEKVEKPVTQNQRGDNKNEYVQLANTARRSGVEPWPLRPTCSDMSTVAAAGEGSVIAMLELIARLTETRLAELDTRRSATALLVAFGGALHNDVAPAPERASFSFGPALLRATRARYVELDAFVPEHIKDTDSWRRMPFYPHYDAKAHPNEATLFRLGPSSFVLVFAQSPP